MRLPSDATLLVVDARPSAGEPLRAPRDPTACIAHLIDVWRSMGLAMVHVCRAIDGQQSEPASEGREIVMTREAASAFVGTWLDDRLTERGCTTLVVCGFETDLSVEATVRHAADLGFRLFVVADACAAPERTDLTGRRWTSEDVQALALTRMALAGATIVDTRTSWIAAKTAGWGRK